MFQLMNYPNRWDAWKQLLAESQQMAGVRVLVARFWPDNLPHKDVDCWLPSAAPSPCVIADWEHQRTSRYDYLLVYTTSLQMLPSCHIQKWHGTRQYRENYRHSPLMHLRHLEIMHGRVTLVVPDLYESGNYGYALLRLLRSHEVYQRCLCSHVLRSPIERQTGQCLECRINAAQFTVSAALEYAQKEVAV